MSNGVVLIFFGIISKHLLLSFVILPGDLKKVLLKDLSQIALHTYSFLECSLTALMNELIFSLLTSGGIPPPADQIILL